MHAEEMMDLLRSLNEISSVQLDNENFHIWLEFPIEELAQLFN